MRQSPQTTDTWITPVAGGVCPDHGCEMVVVGSPAGLILACPVRACSHALPLPARRRMAPAARVVEYVENDAISHATQKRLGVMDAICSG